MRNPKSLYLFMAPALAIYIAFFVIPTVLSLQYSVTDWDGLSPDFNYVGFANYQRVITGDSVFHTAITNNLKFMGVVVIFQTLLSLVFALMLTKNSRSSVLLRAIFFFPTILSSVSVAFIWAFIYDPNLGLLNNALLPALGMDSQPWLGSEDLAIYWLGVTQVWFHTGQMMVVFIAGLQGIPSDYYEAAAVEGAGPWQRFRHVTWPLVAPATAIVVAYTTIQSFRAFDLVYAMTRGGPNHATEIMATWIYKTAFEPPNRFGVAAAQSVIFMLFIGAVTFAQRRTLKLMKADL